MTLVKRPFHSGWASGTVGKLVTCRACYNQKFVMTKYRDTNQSRTNLQLRIQGIGAHKVSLQKQFWKVAEWRSARLGMNKLNLSLSANPFGTIRPLRQIPPLRDCREK